MFVIVNDFKGSEPRRGRGRPRRRGPRQGSRARPPRSAGTAYTRSPASPPRRPFCLFIALPRGLQVRQRRMHFYFQLIVSSDRVQQVNLEDFPSALLNQRATSDLDFVRSSVALIDFLERLSTSDQLLYVPLNTPISHSTSKLTSYCSKQRRPSKSPDYRPLLHRMPASCATAVHSWHTKSLV